MVKNICFFSAGFAFNRLNRLKYYEEIFGDDTNIFLYTTEKYSKNEKENYQYKWNGLKKTNIVVGKYDFLLPFRIRKFCKEENIDVITNLGAFPSAFFLLLATLFIRTSYYVNLYGGLYLIGQAKIRLYVRIALFEVLLLFSKKAISVDVGDANLFKRLNGFSNTLRNKVYFLAAPVDETLFSPRKKSVARKKAGLPKQKKIVISVGRISWGKCSDLLIDLIKQNPEVYFVIVGRAIDPAFAKLRCKNFEYHPVKNSEELVEYYSAADIGFFMHRQHGAGLGQTTGESLACGTPAVVPFRRGVPQAKGVFQIAISKEAANAVVRDFLQEPDKEKFNNAARKYCISNLSRTRWKRDYRNVYLDKGE